MPKKGRSWPEEGAKLPSKPRHIFVYFKDNFMAHKNIEEK